MSDLTRGLGSYPQNIPEPKNEDAICAAVVRFVSERRGEVFKDAGRPDKEDRCKKNVEMVIESPSGARAVIEHTRIESFPEQIADGKAFARLLSPLEIALPSFLPDGKYNLIVDCGVAKKVRYADEQTVRLSIAMWVVKTAPTLAENGRITERPMHVPFDVTLQRWPQGHRPRRLLIQRFSPPDLEEQRAQRVRTALHNKLPKLADCKSRFKANESILILESDDIALANAAAILEAVDAELAARNDKPDTMYIVETEIKSSWVLWIGRERGDASPQIRQQGYFNIGGQADA